MVEIRDKLIEFAQNNSEIYAIYGGNTDPDGTRVNMYYFLINGDFDWALSDRMSDLELGIYEDEKEGGKSIHTLQWPVRQDDISDYPFLKKHIWSRN